MTNKIKASGKSVSGGKLWRVFRGANVIGTVVKTSFGFVSQYGTPSETTFEVHDTQDEAFAAALAW